MASLVSSLPGLHARSATTSPDRDGRSPPADPDGMTRKLRFPQILIAVLGMGVVPRRSTNALPPGSAAESDHDMWSRVARGEQDGRERHEGGTRRRSAADTRRSRRHPADTRDRAALRGTRCGSQAVKVGLVDPRRDSHRSRAGGGRPRHGDPFVLVVARRRRRPSGADRRPRSHRTTRSPRCARATRAGRCNGAGWCEGGNGPHGPAGSGWCDWGDWRPGTGWCDWSNWSERHGRRQHNHVREVRCSQRSTRLSARALPPRRRAPKVSLLSAGVRRSPRRASRTRASRCGPPIQRPPTGGGP